MTISEYIELTISELKTYEADVEFDIGVRPDERSSSGNRLLVDDNAQNRIRFTIKPKEQK